MITPALLNYIQQSLAAGKSKDRIKSELMLAGGWQESEIETAFITLQTPPYQKTASSKVGSFFLAVFIIIVVLGGLGFAAEKFFGPVISDIGSNIVSALPWTHQQAAPTPAPVTPTPTTTPAAVAQTPTTTSLSPDTSAISQTSAPLVNCNDNDMDCLLQAAATCNPANETNTVSTTTPKETSTRTYAIIGPENSMCSMTFSVKSDTTTTNQGKGALCTLSNDNLITMLNDWKVGKYNATDVSLTNQCTGSYFNN